MRHLTPEAIRRIDHEAITHLEQCQRCRAALDVDVDLPQVRQRILGHIADIPVLSPQTSTQSSRWPSNRWVAAAVAAAAVIAIILPVIWFGFPTGPDTADSDAAMSDNLSVEPVEPVIELPERPPEPRPAPSRS